MKKGSRIVVGLMIAMLAVASSGLFASGASEKDATTDSGPVSLRFSWWGNDSRHKATIAVIDQYMAKNPNVQIAAEYRGKSEREKIATELAGGTVADIVQLNPPWMGDFTSAGDFFADLGQYSSILDTKGFSKQFLDDYCMYNGKLIALPTGLNARTSIINKTLANKFGISTSLDTTWTWDDFVNIGKKIQEQDPEKYLLNADSVDMTEFVLLPYLVQLTGNQLIKDDYTRGFSADEFKNALSFISKLYTEKVVIPAQEGNVFLNSIWTNPKWLNGNIVMEFSWTSLYDAVAGDMKDDMGTFILPVMKNAKNTGLIIVPSQLLAISNKSKAPMEAAKFINYFLNDLEAGKTLKDVRAVPPVDTVQEACESAGLINENIIKATVYAQKNQGLYRNYLSSNAEIVKVLNDAVEKVAYDSNSIDKVTNDSIKLIDYILNELKN
ncbi:ABC transporter substrate-binding protein [uncultured Sphaerochaeta sp.]|uniref:ABC transporter substrate-binding protein n=1 Tax=uncultured Sphaerochaeta sp. TaxID=886478 RepID=UPI002A0A93A2|nr:ABC transporter substrate-binding protein [uncultured Sphaerochaeta sp.]